MSSEQPKSKQIQAASSAHPAEELVASDSTLLNFVVASSQAERFRGFRQQRNGKPWATIAMIVFSGSLLVLLVGYLCLNVGSPAKDPPAPVSTPATPRPAKKEATIAVPRSDTAVVAAERVPEEPTKETPAVASAAPLVAEFPLRLPSILDRPEWPHPLEAVAQVGHIRLRVYIAFSPDGRRVVSVCADGDVRVWDAGTGHLLRQITGHPERVPSVAFSPDGRRLVTACDDRVIRVWDVESGTEQLRTKSPEWLVGLVAFMPDGQSFMSVAEHGQIKRWDAIDGRELSSHREDSVSANSLAVARDGRFVVWGGKKGELQIGDATGQTGLRQLVGHEAAIECVALSSDERRLASASRDMTLRVWDVATGAEIQSFDYESMYVRCVAFSPDGKRIGVSLGTPELRMLDIESGGELWRIDHADEGISHFAFSPSGEQFLAAGNGELWLRDSSTGKKLIPFGHPLPEIECLAFSPDGDQLVAGGDDDTIWQWDMESGNVRYLEHDGAIQSVMYSPDGKQILSVVPRDGSRLWDAATGEALRRIGPKKFGNRAAAFSPDGQTIVSSTDECIVHLYAAATGELTWEFEPDEISTEYAWIDDVAFSLDGSRIVSTGMSHAAILRDAKSGDEIGRVAAKTYQGYEFATYSPDGKMIALAGSTRTLLCDANLKPLPEERQLRHLAYSRIVFSPDGKTLALGGYNASVILFDVLTGKEWKRLSGHRGDIASVVFSPDGRRLVSGGRDGIIFVWDVKSGKPLARLYRFADRSWLVLTPEGFFDGSPAGLAKLAFRTGRGTLVPSETFADFQQPGLLKNVIRGELPQPAPSENPLIANPFETPGVNPFD